MMFARKALIAALLALCAGPATVSAQTTSTAPTTAAAVLPADSPIRKQFADLASDDPNRRSDAREKLMGMSADDLPALKSLVEQSAPVTQSQIAALRSVVAHVYLASEKTDVYPGMAFLGIRWLTAENPPRLGVTVDQLSPGFPSYVALREGDLILSVIYDPSKPLDRLPNKPTPTRAQLTGEIATSGPGATLNLAIIRHGEPMQIHVNVIARPRGLPASSLNGQDEIDQFFRERQERADAYWQSKFAPILSASDK